MTEVITGHTREQVLEAHSVASNAENDLPVPQGTKMVTVISLVAEEHQDYVRKEYSAVAVEIDGIKFMLTPSQLVPEGRTKILPSRVRDSDDGNGNKKPVPAGFGVGAGGEQVQVKPKKEVKMKNNTLHKQLKVFQDKWFTAEVALLEHKIILAEGASDNPENLEAVKQYQTELANMMVELKEEFKRMDAKRRHIMEAFPYSSKERAKASKSK